MPLESEERIVGQVQVLLGFQRNERDKLDKVRRYWKGKQDLPVVVSKSAPREVREMARIARVNISDIVVESLAQSLIVDGFRVKRQRENAPPWNVWQANRLDRGQFGVHRAGLAFGTSYAIVLPGDTDPVVRGVSPRRITAMYGEDPEWPIWALERHDKDTYRLVDDEAVYFVGRQDGDLVHIETREHGMRVHGMRVCPVVRFRDAEDLDADDDIQEARDEVILGQVAPMMNLQDQVNLTSFNLLIAQHYTAFRQRWIIGWTGADENETLKATASKVWTIDQDAETVKVGEFGETSLEGYINSRETALKYAATISQTPVHELIGQMVNLSAEALAAAEAGKDRKVAERKIGFGESWEQVFRLIGSDTGQEIPDDAQVRWRDTSAKAFGAIVDGLGKLATMLGVPPQALWERIPDVTDQDIERWKELAASGDPFSQLSDLLERQTPEEE